jgi:hypothetical protein
LFDQDVAEYPLDQPKVGNFALAAGKNFPAVTFVPTGLAINSLPEIE